MDIKTNKPDDETLEKKTTSLSGPYTKRETGLVMMALMAGTAWGILVQALNALISPTDYGIPQTKDVHVGYVVPEELRVKVEDIDGNGSDEVILEYKGHRCLFVEEQKTIDGRLVPIPTCKEYFVEPTSIKEVD